MRQLEELHSLMLDRIAVVPAFRRGSLQVGCHKCGRTAGVPAPGEPGQCPRGLCTRTAKGLDDTLGLSHRAGTREVEIGCFLT